MRAAYQVDFRPPPTAPAPSAFRMPACRRLRLNGGFRLVAAESPEVPLVQLQLVVPAGAEHDPPGLAGLASIVTPLLRAGSTRHGSGEIATAVEGLGADLVTAVDWESGSLRLELLADDLETGLDLLFELAGSPAFPEPAIESSRRQRVSQLRQRRFQPAVLATDCLMRGIYGDTVYGSSLLGTEAGLHRLTREQLLAFHRTRFDPAQGCLVAAGQFATEELARLVKPRLWGATGAVAPLRAPAIPHGPAGRKVYVLDLPEVASTELRLGHTGVPRSHPDLPALLLVNEVLGGSSLSRLTRNVRERHNYTYFVHSRFVARRGPGPFLVSTAVGHRHAGATVEEILGEIRRLQEEPVPAAEVRAAQGFLSGAMQQPFVSPRGLVQQLVELEVHDLPEDHLERCLADIERVDPAGVMELARRHFAPDHMVLVAAGPAAELERQLAGYGTVRVVAPEALDELAWDPPPEGECVDGDGVQRSRFRRG